MSDELKLEHLRQELREIDNDIFNWEYKLSAIGRVRNAPLTPIAELEINRELQRLRNRKREIEGKLTKKYERMDRADAQQPRIDETPQAVIPAQEISEQQPKGTNNHEYMPEIASLFDPLNRAGIEKLFPNNNLNWKETMERAGRNGLIKARIARGRFNPAIVAAWLINEGHLSQEQADRKLVNNLPARSKDHAHLITGNFP